MYVIAMTNEIGTPSEAIAERISERLSIAHLVHGEARRGPVGFVPGPGEEIINLSDWRSRSGFDDGLWSVARVMARKILESADRGDVVIRSSGAPTILRHVDHVLRVRVCASIRTRAQTVMELYGLDDLAAATEIIETADKQCAKLFDRRPIGASRGSETYDVVLNTDRLSVEHCADQVVRLAESPAFQPTAASMATMAAYLADSRREDRALQTLPSDVAKASGPRFLAGHPVSAGEEVEFHTMLRRAEAALYDRWLERETDHDVAPATLKPCWD